MLFFQLMVFSQENGKKYSFEFNSVDLKTAIESIEKESNFKFFFQAEWLDNNKQQITGSYKNITIDELLNQIFNPTEINFLLIKIKLFFQKTILLETNFQMTFWKINCE